ncbi:vegetative cell wall protein gp1-like [Ananas comosus]|uniref:Vegetative cell wall protein gp1-like n=1 Tax=Ananas comosus TaxID=4615 RepID=A0A6P5FVP7_ANACO|nr:vegetative cell wall protein gp1-like [Ananas comosus]
MEESYKFERHLPLAEVDHRRFPPPAPTIPVGRRCRPCSLRPPSVSPDQARVGSRPARRRHSRSVAPSSLSLRRPPARRPVTPATAGRRAGSLRLPDQVRVEPGLALPPRAAAIPRRPSRPSSTSGDVPPSPRPSSGRCRGRCYPRSRGEPARARVVPAPPSPPSAVGQRERRLRLAGRTCPPPANPPPELPVNRGEPMLSSGCTTRASMPAVVTASRRLLTRAPASSDLEHLPLAGLSAVRPPLATPSPA